MQKKISRKAISQVQSTSIIAIIVIVLVIAGSAYYISTVPAELTTVTQTATATTTTTVGGGTTTVTQTTTQTVTQTTTVTGTPAPVKVGMILSASPSISLWDQSGLNGLLSAQEGFGIEFEFVEWVTHEENERALRSMADRGFDIIFDHDTVMQDTVTKVAPDYPDTWFGTPYGQPAVFGEPFENPNQFGYSPDSQQSAYLGGIVLGLMTETNKIGYPVGYLFPFMWASANAFKLGVATVNPNVETFVVEMLTWTDPIKGKDTAQALIDQGCDVFVHLASGAEVGVVEALRENDIPAVAGSAMEATGFYELQVGSYVYSHENCMRDVIGYYVRDGTLQNINYLGGVDLGWVYVAYENPDLVPEEAYQKVFMAEQQLGSGALAIPYLPNETPPEWGGDFEAIPHGLEGFSDCTQCHQVGGAGVGEPGGTGTPDGHAWYWSNNCLACHQP
jgi:basic membrane protein A